MHVKLEKSPKFSCLPYLWMYFRLVWRTPDPFLQLLKITIKIRNLIHMHYEAEVVTYSDLSSFEQECVFFSGFLLSVMFSLTSAIIAKYYT